MIEKDNIENKIQTDFYLLVSQLKHRAGKNKKKLKIYI